MEEIKIIGWEDTKEEYNEETQQNETVPVFIPECCRKGFKHCPHVVNTDIKEKKRNIGL